MKKQLMTNLILALSLFVGTYASGQGAATDYMDAFSKEYRTIQQDMWDYTSSVSHGKSARKVEKRRAELIQTSNTALTNAKAAKAFNSSSRFKDSVVRYFMIVNIVLKEDYSKIVNMEEVAEESYDAMEAYMLARERANAKLQEAGEMINREQRKFCEDNSITLLESKDPLQEKMAVAGKVYEHYNEVYLIFFKTYKQEVYLMAAIEKKDLSAIEQNRAALKATAEESLKKLEKMQGYNGDKSLVDATRELLKFYLQEASGEVSKISEFYLKAENFEKVKTAFEQKKEKDRKQADVDAYNKAVNDMNAAAGTFSSVTQSLNTQRAKLVDNWNKVAQKLTDKYVPKGK